MRCSIYDSSSIIQNPVQNLLKSLSKRFGSKIKIQIDHVSAPRKDNYHVKNNKRTNFRFPSCDVIVSSSLRTFLLLNTFGWHVSKDVETSKALPRL